MHKHKTNSDSSVSALDTRDNKLISKSSVFKPKSATDTRDNKLISKPSVFKPKSATDTIDNKLISKQYPSHKEISGASTKPTLTQVKDNI